MCLQIELGELGVVVEHFFEMGHEPFGVHGVAGEAAAELVMDAARRHAFAGVEDAGHGLGILEPPGRAQQKPGDAGLRKFRRAAEPAIHGVVSLQKLPGRCLQCLRGEGQVLPGFLGHQHFQSGLHFVGRGHELRLPLAPEPDDVFEELTEAGAAVAGLGRKIGTAIKRLELRRQKQVQRPAAAPGGGLDKGHVNLVHIRPLFAVHLDADKVLVQIGAEGGVFEALALHHMAPVAGGVADA